MNRSRKANKPGRYLHYAYGLLFLIVLLSACTPVQNQIIPTPTETAVVILVPYQTSTVTATPVSSLLTPTKTPLPTPTATPFTHIIKKDETLLGIAFRYGVKLEDLLAANPGINIHFLTIGTVLVIPLTGELATPTPTVPLPPLLVSEPICYASPDLNFQCLAEIKNPLQEAYEKLTLKFALYARDGTLISEQFIVPPLDRLKPRDTLPVLASFSVIHLENTHEEYSAQLTLLSALPILDNDNQASSSRYLEPVVEDLQVLTSGDFSFATVTGTVGIPEGTSSLWLVAVAYDEDHNPVGLRRLEFDEICPVQASETPDVESSICMELPFELFVYSLGPAVDRVDLFVEAHR